MEQGFKFEVIWRDNDVLELRASAFNGTFSGVTDVYEDIHGLSEIAAKIQGFPTNSSDFREVTLGAFGPKCAGGGISIRFYCADGSGHAYVESRIESGADTAGVTQSTILVVPIEAAAVDSFVAELHQMDKTKAGVACLRAADGPTI